MKQWRSKSNKSLFSRPIYKKDWPKLIEAMVDDGLIGIITDKGISFNGQGSNDSFVHFTSVGNAASSAYGIQLLSNGFKFKGSDSASATVNGSGQEYVYVAFASEALVSSNDLPATAN